MDIAYFEDLKLHRKFTSPGYHLKEKEIIAYAKKWDPFPFHTDPVFAKNTPYGGLIASGNHVEAIAVRLAHYMNPKIAWIAGLGLDKLRYNAPARPGDILTLENEVTWKRKSKSDPQAGIIKYTARLINQRDEIVFSSVATGMVTRRPTETTADRLLTQSIIDQCDCCHF